MITQEETVQFTQPPPPPQPPMEEFQLTGERVIAKVKEVVHEGNVRRIIVKNDDGHVLAEFPLALGVVGILLAPAWAALGAIAALATNCTVVVERRE